MCSLSLLIRSIDVRQQEKGVMFTISRLELISIYSSSITEYIDAFPMSMWSVISVPLVDLVLWLGALEGNPIAVSRASKMMIVCPCLFRLDSFRCFHRWIWALYVPQLRVEGCPES